VDKAQKRASQRVEAGKVAAKVLEFVEAAFDQLPLALAPALVVALDSGALMRRDDGLAPTRLHLRHEIGRCLPTIRNHALKGQPVEQRLRRGYYRGVGLPSSGGGGGGGGGADCLPHRR
jgi:hypothetical protein